MIVVISQQLLIIDQFVPWIRLDGYHIVSDLIGVSDLFTRIKPVIKSLFPGRAPDPRVTELKRWARLAVTGWVLSTVVALSAMAVVVITNISGYLRRAWLSLFVQLDWVQHGARIGSVADVLVGAIGAFMLVLPVAGITFTYLLLCRGVGASLAVRRTRLDLTLAARDGGEIPQWGGRRFPTATSGRGNTWSQVARFRAGRSAAQREHRTSALPAPHTQPQPQPEGEMSCAS